MSEAERPIAPTSESEAPEASEHPQLPSTLGLEEAAKLLRCSSDTLRKRAAAREVPATKVGREWVFHTELLLSWLKGNCERDLRRPIRVDESTGLAEQLHRDREARLKARRKLDGTPAPKDA